MHGLWERLSGKLSTVGKYAILSAIPIVIFGMLLSYLLNDFVYRRTLATAEDQAELVAGLGPVQDVRARDITNGERSLRWHSLVADLEDTSLGAQGSTVKVWDSDLQIVFSSDSSIVGHTSFNPEHLHEGLRGETKAYTSEPAADGDEDILSVVTPVRPSASEDPIGVLEISVPYAPLARAVKRDFRIFYVVLVIGLNLLYVALFGVMMRASRRLRERAEEQEHLALHDVLTGLANRALFRDRVKQALRVAEREQQTVAVLLMDLDRFKEINDTLGHHHGDIVLQETARRLQATLRETDTIARLGGDEFAMVLPHVPDPAAVVLVADKIRAALRVPFIVQGLSLDVRASIGVAFFPGHGKDVDTLIQRADVAMYLAKTAQSGCEIYAVEKDQYSPSRLALVGELRNAIEHDEFVVHYQPKVDLKTGEVKGVEALLRWEHPLRKLIPPDEFIPLAEHTGLIEPLTSYVLNQSLRQVSEWREDGLDLKVAVNLSTRSLLNAQFPDEVSKALKKWRIPPSSLQLEITEHTILADPARAAGVLATLSNMGVELSIDDFGTGYSSFVQLRRLPLTELKIDKSFVMNMNVDENDAVIVRSLIELGRNLGLQVVAEGVESEQIRDDLTKLGCDFAQGFFTSRPMPADQLVRWLNVMSQPSVN
ncbi:MAG: EAL domain-containing protein [Actinobacteria bacterium]|nr:EAL domain-containing protein [Actinomycetota bacterium]